MMKFLCAFCLLFTCINDVYGSNEELFDKKEIKTLTTTNILPNVLWKFIVQKLDGKSAKQFLLVSKLANSFVEKRKSIKFKVNVPSNVFYQIVKTRKPEHLNISGCKGILSKDLYKTASFCTDLKYLDISRCGNITSPSIFEISHNWPNLEIIKMDYCHDITPGDLRVYLKSNKLDQKTITIFKYAFKIRKINLGRAMDLSESLED